MSNAQPHDWTLTEAADAIANGDISSVELTEHCLHSAAEAQRVLNCFINLHHELAHTQAEEADAARARGASLGPLHGVPLAHKDMFYRAGVITQAVAGLEWAGWSSPGRAGPWQCAGSAGRTKLIKWDRRCG